MKNSTTGIGILIGSLISTAIVGYFVQKQNEKQRVESEKLAKETTEKLFQDAFPKVEFIE